jgi:hypothetical protein
MKTFETSATVQDQGDIRVAGVPFAPGTEVEVTISPKRESAAKFVETWNRVCSELRRLPQASAISDDDIQSEINDHRART